MTKRRPVRIRPVRRPLMGRGFKGQFKRLVHPQKEALATVPSKKLPQKIGTTIGSTTGSVLGSAAGGTVGAYLGGPTGGVIGSSLGGEFGSKLGAMAGHRGAVIGKKLVKGNVAGAARKVGQYATRDAKAVLGKKATKSIKKRIKKTFKKH